MSVPQRTLRPLSGSAHIGESSITIYITSGDELKSVRIIPYRCIFGVHVFEEKNLCVTLTLRGSVRVQLHGDWVTHQWVNKFLAAFEAAWE